MAGGGWRTDYTGRDVEADVLPQLVWLKKRLGLSKADFAKTMFRGGWVAVGMDREEDVEPRVALWEAGITAERVREEVVKEGADGGEAVDVEEPE